MLHAELTGGTARHAADRAWLLRLLSTGLRVCLLESHIGLRTGELPVPAQVICCCAHTMCKLHAVFLPQLVLLT